MCRWLMYLGDPILVSHLLTLPKNSLVNQSLNCNYSEIKVNGDGFGMGWYTNAEGERPRAFLYKNTCPAWNDENLRELSHCVVTRCVMAHVRAASPMSLISRSNCHPFRMGRYVFMHNGDVAGFSQLRRTMQESLLDWVYPQVQGATDSEMVFGLFMSILGSPDGEHSVQFLAQTLRTTMAAIIALQKLARIEGDNYFNFALTDGTKFVAVRCHTGSDEDPPSLFWNAGSSMRYDESREMFLVAEGRPGDAVDTVLCSSEPLASPEGTTHAWNEVPKNSMLLVSESYPPQIQTQLLELEKLDLDREIALLPTRGKGLVLRHAIGPQPTGPVLHHACVAPPATSAP